MKVKIMKVKIMNNIKEYINKEEISEEEFELIMNIVKLRKDMKISQTELEKLTGISQANIARFEKNIHSSSLSTVLRVLNALGYKLTITKK